jgi:hypothetical protein
MQLARNRGKVGIGSLGIDPESETLKVALQLFDIFESSEWEVYPVNALAVTGRLLARERRETFALTDATAGELATVTMPHLCEHMSMLRLRPF